MSSQIPTSLASPPRKRGSKKGKRCSSNGDDTSRSTKAQRIKGDHAPASKSAAVEHHDESQTASAIATQEPRRSGRAGAGSGGRTQQLEKVAAILEDRPVRSRQSTDLPEDTAANPLAPPAKSVKSGRRGVGKKAGLESLPPPPYAPAAPCQVQTGPALMTPVPVFHERSSGSDRFGFSAPAPALQPVGIPRTEPNLQIPYVAAQEQQKRFLSPPPPELLQQPRSGSLVGPPRLASSRSLESQSLPSHKASVSSRTLGSQLLDPTPFSNSPPSHKTPAPSRALESRSINPTLLGSSLPSWKASVSSRALKSQSIDPSLLDNSLPSRKTFQSLPDHRRVVEHTEPSEGDSSSQNDKSTSESGAPDETETEHDEAWGATNSRQVAHPGFSKEVQPNLPIRHASLPPDHEFQFSRDEDDESAWRNLDNAEPQHGGTSHPSNCLQIDDSRSPDNAEYQERGDTANNTESQPGNAVDVLDRHHQVNGHPSAPDPQALTSVPPQPDGMQESARTRAPRNSKKAKEAGPLPKNLGFYPSGWQDCLEDAKRECRVSHLLSNNPFPSKSRDLKTSITEALTTTISEWNESAVFEPGYWPDHKTGMACVLLGDMSTWRSELKTVAFAVCPVAYNLIPPQEIPPREKVQWVQNSAAQLLADSFFLRGGFNQQGKTNNFAHPALMEVAIRFFYTGSYRIADKRPDQFRKAIPLACIALAGAAINCVLDGFAKNGAVTLKTIPQFSGKEYRSTFLTMSKMLNEILRHPYHGRKLHKQVGKWGEEGWAVLYQVDTDVERDNHLHLILN
ncbi:hypothetical protein L210DRAFT_3653115 [Boletus edulis BED1]|uniref:DUF6532 domain-containing protein n=1 Tax=Boletus edulis BED1 TaxID=1328754 RepID=A0AAD4BFU6_BOLED|nr:hypothetical protein L210DRAFT_3653115 [Boletus edulis BED1]